MDSAWSMLESDSPSPPPLPPPINSTARKSINNIGQTVAAPKSVRIAAQQFPASGIDPPTTSTAGGNGIQFFPGSTSGNGLPLREAPYPGSLPPPIYGQYPPCTPMDIRAQAQHTQQYLPQYAQNYTNHPLTTPYSNSFHPRRQVYDSQSNGVISKIAEEKTRSAFNSILVVLDTFSSVSEVLENTFNAIHNSFRTITNVADHIIFLRNHFAELALIPSAIQVLSKFFRWLLQAFGFGKSKLFQQLDEQLKDQIWNDSFRLDNASEIPSDLNDPSRILHANSYSSSAWPILAFISLVFGTPYLVRKLIGAPAEVIPKTNRPAWTTRSGNHYQATALHDFVARNSNELSFTKDSILYIKPESMQPGTKWLIATIANDNTTMNFGRSLKPIGLVPVDYVRILIK